MNDQALQFINLGNGECARKIAVRHVTGKNSGFMWLGGYNSDMLGTKAEQIDLWAQSKGLMSTRHDYSGHGESGGKFTDGTISRWLEESLTVLREVTTGPQVLVGSSMGGWIAIRMVQELIKSGEGDRVSGLVLIAPAPDFTQTLMEPKFSDVQRKDMANQGYIEQPTPYADTPNIITRALIEDGKENAVLNSSIQTNCPVRIIQGMNDPDVPHAHALKLIECLDQDDCVATFIKDGDHRLSREADIKRIILTCEDILQTK
jgi:pimeloyl-ACP methyl ester carboxylesterase